MSSEYSKWLSTLPNINECSGNKSQHCTLLEGLVLDLQVVSADLFGLQGLLSSIAKRLQVLEVSVSDQLSPMTEVSE